MFESKPIVVTSQMAVALASAAGCLTELPAADVQILPFAEPQSRGHHEGDEQDRDNMRDLLRIIADAMANQLREPPQPEPDAKSKMN